ncbi:glycosyltransferase family 4 protein [uncultured Microbacterium sp.]|uniref:glycosyltransferase family 4 protein n=1 Tax=uncultured Microbacterium sp. TaxID=191216 RepID=UPI0037478C71
MISSAPRPRILHLVDRVTGGVPVAVRAYVAHSPVGVEHVIASPFRAGAPAPVWDGLDVGHIEWDTSTPYRAIRTLRRIVGTESFPVLHAHSSYPGAYARLLVSPRRTHLVYTPHCFAFFRADVSAPVRAGYRFVERLLVERTSVLAACGPGEMTAAERLGFGADRIVMIPNVPSIAEDPAVRLDTDPGRAGTLRVGMLGRWTAQKDPAYFAARVAELAAGLPSIEVDGCWIGSTEDRATPGIPGPHVHQTGWLAPSEVGERLRDLDIYLHSAAWEGFPIALLDARAAGLPILCRRIAALPDLPPPLSVDGGLPALTAAVRAGRFAEWRDGNRAQWDVYLGDRSAHAQRRALARAWTPGLNAASRL